MADSAVRKTSIGDGFGGVPGQKPLPAGDLDSSPHAGTPSRHDSKRSAASGDSQDVDMDDDNTAGGSDNESTAGSSKPSKKKKGQRFYCTDYPPCNLSFTRSEHLARHIRKHTGERPFQCHCLRRFSRLDNLRQHAQTVHVNEDIPPESLAATGTRFQRQIRTDRVRSRGNSASISRPGAAAAAAAMTGRGHSRNVSTSSIGSVSDLGSPEDVRRRHQPPPPLAIAQATSPQGALHVDTYGSHYSQQQENGPYYNMNQPSPNGYTTPTSVYSPENTAAGSRYSGLGSPIAMMPPGHHQHHHSHSHSHSHSYSHSHSHSQSGSGSSHARRLSQPSSSQSYYQAPYYSPPPSNGPYYLGASSSSSATAYPNNGSMFASPTTSTAFLPDGRQESSAEAEWRRRTWHPGTYSNAAPRPATSGLSYYQTPDAPQPVSADQPAAAQPQSSSNASAALRLPGIDSFDRGGAAAAPPPRRPLSTMEVDEPTRQAHEVAARPLEAETPSKRDSWGSVNQHFSQLDVKGTPTKRDSTCSSSWRHSAPVPPGGPQYLATPSFTFPPQPASAQNQSQEPPLTPSKTKHEPNFRAPLRGSGDSISTVRTSPEGSLSSDGLPTPSHHSAAEYHPAIVHSSGYVETHPPGSMVVESPPKSHHRSRSAISSYNLDSFPSSLDASRLPQPPRHHRHHSANTSRLDALVAVATNEERALQGH